MKNASMYNVMNLINSSVVAYMKVIGQSTYIPHPYIAVVVTRLHSGSLIGISSVMIVFLLNIGRSAIFGITTIFLTIMRRVYPNKNVSSS